MGWLHDYQNDWDYEGSISERERGLFPQELREVIIRLHRFFEPWRRDLLTERSRRQSEYDRGVHPTYLSHHPAHTESWQVAHIPNDLMDRRVEITGPVNSAKMVINMLNPNAAGELANTAMLDFEDSMAPTWENVKAGYQNIKDLANQTLKIETEGKQYELSEKIALPMIRVRGLHMNETHVEIDGQAVSASLMDLAVCAYHSAGKFQAQGKTPKYYVPKCEHYLEARWWNRLFRKIERELGLTEGTMRVTFLIETLPAAFQIEEILYEIRERACGLNVGRWDKIFSDIKTLRNHSDRVLAERSFIDMAKPWMENYAKRLIKICHRHGAFAIGGMSACTPGKDTETRTLQALKVKQDKTRESEWGHDGCWVSHPYFIGTAREEFKRINQLDIKLENFPERPDLLPNGAGPKTLAGLKTNVRVAIAYLVAWNQGIGCIAIDNFMEDLATLEISRAQVWQWIHHKAILDEGVLCNVELVTRICDEECARLLGEMSEEVEDLNEFKVVCTRYLLASMQARELFFSIELPDFLSTFNFSRGKDAKIREGTRKPMEDGSSLEGREA